MNRWIISVVGINNSVRLTLVLADGADLTSWGLDTSDCGTLTGWISVPVNTC